MSCGVVSSSIGLDGSVERQMGKSTTMPAKQLRASQHMPVRLKWLWLAYPRLIRWKLGLNELFTPTPVSQR